MVNEFEQRVYVVRCKKEAERLVSQSGGAFGVIAKYILGLNGCVYGVVQDAGLKVKYERVEDIDGLKKLHGSKYVQAFIKDEFLQVEEDLMHGKYVFFTGTPCFIDGLLNYLYIKKCDISQLITGDLVCHGVVSPQIYSEYLENLRIRNNAPVKKFIFRDKRFGWKAHRECYSVKGRQMVSSNYTQIFYSNYCLREICYQCPYASLNRVSDITMGDYWGINNIYPEMDDDKGVSLLLINTKKGYSILEKCEKDFYIKETGSEDCLQPNLQGATEKPVKYPDFWKSYYAKGFLETVKTFCDVDEKRDFERLEKKQYIKRIRSKLERMYKALESEA